MNDTPSRLQPAGGEPNRREELLRLLGEKLVQLGWQRPNSPELEAHVDIFRQHATDDQIEGLARAIERRLADGPACGR